MTQEHFSATNLVACVKSWLRPLGLAVIVLSVFFPVRANAQLTQYYTRDEFNAACPGLPIEGIEKARVGPAEVTVLGNPLDKFTSTGGFSPGDVLEGLRIETSGPSLAILGDTSYGVHSIHVFGNHDRDTLTITFYNGSVSCVGLDVSVLFDPTTVRGEFFDVAGNSLGSISVAATVAGDTFLGASSSTPISHVKITAPDGIYKGIDNVAFGTTDTTPPNITAKADRQTIWPVSGKMVPVTISGSIVDLGSGVDSTSVRYAVIDDYGAIQPSGPIEVQADGSYSFTLMVEARRKGSDKAGRNYSVVITGADIAGNTSTAEVVVTVPHDQR